mmetsp:Transcript_25423/g.59163  ORF Transcript_25423/g.59163 Transcript_25423/m.59163 type:complete len:298 (+) Transcript_25423:50-943(+)
MLKRAGALVCALVLVSPVLSVRPALDDEDGVLEPDINQSFSMHGADMDPKKGPPSSNSSFAEVSGLAIDPPSLDNCRAKARELKKRGEGSLAVVDDKVFENRNMWMNLYWELAKLVKYTFTKLSTIAAVTEAVFDMDEGMQVLHRNLENLEGAQSLPDAERLALEVFRVFTARQGGLQSSSVTKAVRTLAQKIQSFTTKCYKKSRYAKKFADYYAELGQQAPSSGLLKEYRNPGQIAVRVVTLLRAYKEAEWQALQEACLPEDRRDTEALRQMRDAVASIPQRVSIPSIGFREYHRR